MRIRQFHSIWATVVCLSAIAVGLLPGGEPEAASGRVNLTSDVLVETEEIPEASIAVIGSSLMRYAVPPVGSTGYSLLSDGRTHVRLALGNITEEQQIALLTRVLASDVEYVFVEIQPFGIDFRFEEWRQQTFLHGLVNQARRFSLTARRALGRKFRRRLKTESTPGQPPSLMSEADKLDAEFHVSQAALSLLYPIHERSLVEKDRLDELISVASARQVKLALIAPPRSQTAADYMGTARSKSLEKHFQKLAEELGVPLFQPARWWTDDYFIDQAHMNRRGRNRFCRELAQWSLERL